MDTAVLGTGLMGYPMAQRLLAKGHAVAAFNRTVEKSRPLKDKGARVCASAREAVDAAQCILLVLADGRAISEVVLTRSDISFSAKTVIQMGTIAPDESRVLQKTITAKGGEYLECPVLGSRKESLEGTLICMVGSTREQFQTWREFLTVFDPHPRYIGEVGKAAAVKLAVNYLIASHAAGFSLSLGLVEKHRVPVDIFMEILNQSTLYAKMFDKKLPNWQNRSYGDPNFPVKHLLKDVELIYNEAEHQGLSTEGIDGIRSLLKKTVEQGLADQDYSALFEAIYKKEK